MQRTNTTHIALVGTIALILLAIIPIYSPLLGYPVYLLKRNHSPKSPPPPPPSPVIDEAAAEPENLEWNLTEEDESAGIRFCDLFTGEWVQNPAAPYYTNTSCSSIYIRQDCLKNGRPDSEFLKWRWKPDGCDLPIFNPLQFFEMLRGKSIAFIGDSVNGNQIQSLICLLSRVDYPVSVPTPNENFKLYNYTYFNFAFALFVSPHLVRTTEADPNGPTNTGLFNLYLDEFDPNWTPYIHKFDYILISADQSFFRPSIYYEKKNITGCHYCLNDKIPDLTANYGYQKALRTAFRAINGLKKFKGVTFLRTLSPTHFENGPWDQGGNCNRTAPFRRNQTALENSHLDLYKIQMEEFKAAVEEGKKKGKKFRLMDTMKAMLLRPDGHPDKYDHGPNENATINDCQHWCVPGPIDAMNDFLFEMVKVEDLRSYEEKLFPIKRKLK